MRAFILVKIRSGEVLQAVRDFRRVDCVEAANMTLGPYDAVVVVNADNLNHIGRIVAMDIQPVPGVYETITCLAVEI